MSFIVSRFPVLNPAEGSSSPLVLKSPAFYPYPQFTPTKRMLLISQLFPHMQHTPAILFNVLFELLIHRVHLPLHARLVEQRFMKEAREPVQSSVERSCWTKVSDGSGKCRYR